ncbi:MAG: MipA/OmpV family protein [Woeseiaceae bacterium]|nr:MipA/OmpV family protein [Woeseiaceae bacterium]
MAARRPSIRCITFLALLAAWPVGANGLLDTIRELDLNDYAIGALAITSESVYVGVEDFDGVFPLPMTWRNAIDNDERLFVRDTDVGLRTFFGDGWNAGVVLGVQTTSYGSGESLALAGMARRDWTIQGGFTVGRPVLGIQVDADVQTDLLGEHNGQEYTIRLAKQFDFGRHYIVPQLAIRHQSDRFINHYYGVRQEEALPTRPAYAPGSATSPQLKLEWGWRVLPHWFVTLTGGVEFLPDEIRNSPIVDKNRRFTLSAGLAYDAAALVAANSGDGLSNGLQVEAALGAFLVDAGTTVFLRSGNASSPVSLERDFDVENSELAFPASLTWRIGGFHRLRLNYAQLKRNGASDITVDVDVGDVTFPAGDNVLSSFDTTLYSLAYGFSLLRDAQKELTIWGGVNVAEVRYRATGGVGDVRAETRQLLPTLGLDLDANFTDKLSLEAALSFYLLDFSDHSGDMLNFRFGGSYRITPSLSANLGWQYYRQDIRTADPSFFGEYRFEYRGPQLTLSARF